MTSATGEEIVIVSSVCVSDLTDDALPADVLPTTEKDFNSLILWVENVVEAAIADLQMEGYMCYIPEIVIEQSIDEQQQSIISTRLHQAVWAGMGVLLARLWVIEDNRYQTYAAVLSDPTWLQLCLQIHLMVWSSGHHERHDSDQRLWLSGLDVRADRLQQFGDMPIYKAVFGF